MMGICWTALALYVQLETACRGDGIQSACLARDKQVEVMRIVAHKHEGASAADIYWECRPDPLPHR